MTAKELNALAFERMKKYNIRGSMPALRNVAEGSMMDILNTNGCCYYQWSPCLVDVLNPKQIVELGGAMGAWDLMVLQDLPEDAHLWSITLPEGGLEFSYIKDNYTNFHPVLGDDLNLKNWPKELDLSKTDLWFFDAEHTAEQLQAEIDLYSPFFKKGAVVLFDDIRMPELWPIWENLPYDKYENTNPCHYSGFGLMIV